MEFSGDAMIGGIIKPSDGERVDSALDAALGYKGLDATIAVLRRHEQLIESRRKRERERLSDSRSAQGPDGTTWTYVVVDGRFARLTGCSTERESLEIPSEIDGVSVLELGVQACANLGTVREISCAETIESIGTNAFRGCANLQRLALPPRVARFDATWIAQCPRLAELVCPAGLSTLDAAVFNAENLEVLTLGAATCEVEPGAFAKSRLRELRVPNQNPYLVSDGRSVFSKSGDTLIAVAVACSSFEVPRGCTRIASKAFASCPQLESVVLPDSVVEIGPHAFARTALRSFAAPVGLKHIGRRAFYRCGNLGSVELNEGLIDIGDEAFAETAPEHVRLPASLENLSRNAFDKTGMTFAAGKASCVIAPGGKLRFDAHAALYRDAGEKELVCMMGSSPQRYSVEEGTQTICAEAFAHCDCLREVELPEGVAVIGAGAFRSCGNLAHVNIPESLRAIEDEAFMGTVLESVYLPAQLASVGERAFVTAPAREGEPTSMRTVQVNPNCERFYFTGGLLCERIGSGASRVLLFDDSRESVRIPDEVTEICAYAFSGCQNLRELFVSTHVAHVGTKGLNVGGLIEHIHVDLERPIEGHGSVDLHFPHTLRSAHEIARGFNTSAFIDIRSILARYDACVVNMHDYDAKNSAPVDLYGQVRRIMGRLNDPLYLSETTRSMYTRIVQDNLEDMCVAIARHDDRMAIDALVDLGFLDRETILGVIERVGRLQDAAMTGYLLELQRRLAGTVDFEL